MRIALSLAIFAVVSFILTPTVQALDLFELLNPNLKQLRCEATQIERKLKGLGPMPLGQTTQEVGVQHLMLKDPPPQSPSIQLDLGATKPFDSITLVPAVLNHESADRSAYAFPRRFRVDVSNDEGFQDFDPIYDSGPATFEAVGGLPFTIPTQGKSARFIRITITELRLVSQLWTYALAEIIVLNANQNIALTAQVKATAATGLPPIWLARYVNDGRTPLGPPIVTELPEFDGLFSRTEDPDAENWMMLDLGETRLIDEIRLHPVHARQGADFPGFNFPIRFRVEIDTVENFSDPNVVFSTGEKPFPNPGNNPVTLQADRIKGQFVRIVCLQSTIQTGAFGLSEVEVFSEQKNIAINSKVSLAGDLKLRPLGILVDGFTSYGRLIDLPDWIDRFKQRRDWITERKLLDNQILSAIEVARWRVGVLSIFGIASVLCVSIGTSMCRWRKRKLDQQAFRLHLARDLHDEIGSNLAAMFRLSEVAAIEPSPTDHRDDWNSVKQMALECNESIRETLWLLGGRQKPDGDFCDRLKQVARRMLGEIELQWQCDRGVIENLRDERVQREIHLCSKELFANIVRHSRASRVECSLKRENKSIVIQIHDNGCGISSISTKKGMGLESVRQRIRKLGGSCQVESDGHTGTKVTLSIPNKK